MNSRECQPKPDEESIFSEGSLAEVVEALNRFKPGEFYTHDFLVRPDLVRQMQGYVGKLREGGLDIGKGDSAFGYRMPLPKKGDCFRKLIIFRRK